MTRPERVLPQGTVWAAALLVIAASAALRAYRLDYGLPATLDVDASKWVDDASRMVATGAWKPVNLQYPTFFTYILAGLFRLTSARSVFEQHAMARAVSAAFGTGMVAATWALGRRLGSTVAATAGAALVVFSTVCVTSSRTAATDTMLAFLVTLAVCVLAGPGIGTREMIISGVLVGLATGTKFSGALALPTLWIAGIRMGWVDGRWRRAAAATAASSLVAGASFLLVTPSYVPLMGQYLDRMRLESVLQRSGQLGHVQLGVLDYFFSLTPTCEQPWQGTSLLADVGPAVLGLALVAVALAVAGRLGRGAFLLAAHAVVFLAILCRPGHVKAVRFLLPILPALFVLAGLLVERGLARLTGWRSSPGIERSLAVLVIAGLLLWPASRSLPYVAMHRRESTTARAHAWIAEHVPSGSRVMVWPLFEEDLLTLPYNFLTIDGYGTRQYNLPASIGFSPERQPIFVPELFDQSRDAGLQYVVVNSFLGCQFSPSPENVKWFPVSVEQYGRTMEHIRQSSDRLFEIRGWEERRPGPDITVYGVHAAAAR